MSAALNPCGDNRIERFGRAIAPGDKVMQIANGTSVRCQNRPGWSGDKSDDDTAP